MKTKQIFTLDAFREKDVKFVNFGTLPGRDIKIIEAVSKKLKGVNLTVTVEHKDNCFYSIKFS